MSPTNQSPLTKHKGQPLWYCITDQALPYWHVSTFFYQEQTDYCRQAFSSRPTLVCGQHWVTSIQNSHYKLSPSSLSTLKAVVDACCHSEIKCDIKQKGLSEVN